MPRHVLRETATSVAARLATGFGHLEPTAAHFWRCETVKPPPTPAQKQVLLEDRDYHRVWLKTNKIEELAWPLSENPYTGLILAAVLNPDTRSTVCQGLMAGGSETASAFRTNSLTAAQWPTKGVDLVVRFGHGLESQFLLVEHKRFRSDSHRPGYRTDPHAPWQTDVVYAAATGNDAASWLGDDPASRVKGFIVLDAYGKSMDQLFPGGQFNDKWLVTSYPQFGRVLRAAYEQGVRGLVPLLAALYAGC